MNKFQKTTFILLLFLTLICGFIIYLQNFKEVASETTIVNNTLLIEKIESIGKIELCNYFIKDIIIQKKIKEWYLPNSKVLLIISGEVTGCIDLTKIDSNSIIIEQELIKIKLPAPEICYTKINHQESKIYDIQNEYFNKAKLIDKAYAIAEKTIEKSALQQGIIGQTKDNAIKTLEPLLSSFTNKKIKLYF